MYKKASTYLCILLTAIFGLTSPPIAQQTDRPLIIFAAASLTDALNKHAKNWSQKTGNHLPKLSFAASAIMARQIQAGAPADVFISANTHWIGTILDAGLAEGETSTVAQNQLVFAGSASAPSQTVPSDGQAFMAIVSSNRPIAMADPRTAPAGAYAQRYLENINLWDGLQSRLAFSSNVRQTLLLIERGGLHGFVYSSDTTGNPRVKTIFTVPTELSGAILYKAAKIKGSPQSASDFIRFLLAPENQNTWQTTGFTPAAPK
ncbi:MAG: molybdate ABC transporter substrate-binding protein [Kordiimonas sp.]